MGARFQQLERVAFAFFFSVFFMLAGESPAICQWSIDPAVNTPVSTAPNNQYSPVMVGDGAGGAIMAWADMRLDTVEVIYAQRIDSAGHVLWAKDGIRVCTAAGAEIQPVIVSDLAGGAIIAWEDFRNSSSSSYNPDIYAQRISADGQLEWSANGAAVCTAVNGQTVPAIVGDGSGGAIVAWADERTYSSTAYDIYAQRIDPSGNAMWGTNGVPISVTTSDQNDPAIASDCAGGAIVTWWDLRNGNADIYAQRVNSGGAVQWTKDGVAVSKASADQIYPAIASDKSGGAIIIWMDSRNTTTSYDIYAQRMNSAGAAQWVADGEPVCSATGDQRDYKIAGEGSGGAVVVWDDSRNGNSDIYAQRVDSTGGIGWPADGIPICDLSGDQLYPAVLSDGSGGATIAWTDLRANNPGIYAQRIDAGGNPVWPANDVAVTTVGGVPTPVMVSENSGKTIFAWSDYRNSHLDPIGFTQTNLDVYSQIVDRFGYPGDAAPSLAAVRDVPRDQGGEVTLDWDASPYDASPYQLVTQYSVWRSVPGLTSSVIPAAYGSAGKPGEDAVLSAGAGKYRLRTIDGVTTAWEWIANVPSHYLKQYSFTATTTSDSTSAGISYFKFFVSAESANHFIFWDSGIDSGYSVDNLAPLAPANVGIVFAADKVTLHWNQNMEKDLYGYRIFRSTAADFNPDTMAVYDSTGDTVFVDGRLPSSGSVFYAVVAVDIHGNPSPESNVVGVTLTGVKAAGFVPKVFALEQNYPNPFNPTTTITYDVPKESHVSVIVYDMLGEKVATLIDGERSPGEYRAVFDGSSYASGVYIYRMNAVNKDGNHFVSVKKFLLLK